MCRMVQGWYKDPKAWVSHTWPQAYLIYDNLCNPTDESLVNDNNGMRKKRKCRCEVQWSVSPTQVRQWETIQASFQNVPDENLHLSKSRCKPPGLKGCWMRRETTFAVSGGEKVNACRVSGGLGLKTKHTWDDCLTCSSQHHNATACLCNFLTKTFHQVKQPASTAQYSVQVFL